jgi:hypothetical protein
MKPEHDLLLPVDLLHVLPGEPWALVEALADQLAALVGVAEDAHALVFIDLVDLAGEADRVGSLLGFRT